MTHQLDITKPAEIGGPARDLSHLTRDQLEQRYLLALERAEVAERRADQAELRAAIAERDLQLLQRVRAAGERHRAARSNQLEIT